MFCNTASLNAQNVNNETCFIWGDIEPNKAFQSFSAVQATQDASTTDQWNNSSDAVISNNILATTEMLPNEFSQELTFKGFYVDIPLGATIHGIQLKVSGESSDNSIIKESQIQFFLDESPISSNIAGKSNISAPWKQNNSSWLYGFEYSDWGVTWDIETLQSEELAVKLQLRNVSDTDTLSVGIDDISIIVHYTELYTLCSNDCVVLYNDDILGAIEYNWNVPEGVKFLNNNPQHNVVNLDFSKAVYGVLDVELNIETAIDSFSCSRQVLHQNCVNAQIGNYVWLDENFNGLQDSEESGLADVNLRLFDVYGELVAETITDENGAYLFGEIDHGFYYIQVDLDGYLPSPLNVVDLENNSDLLESGQSEIFYVANGDTIQNLDFGLYKSSSVTGRLWSECEDQGVFTNDDVLLEGITVDLYKAGELINSTSTDSEGKYFFGDLFSGQYSIKLITDKVISVFNANSSAVENVFDSELIYEFELNLGEDRTGISAAFVQPSNARFNFYFDENLNGESDPGENVFDNQWVYLNELNITIDSFQIQNGHITLTELRNSAYSLSFENKEYEISNSNDYDINSNNDLFVISGFELDCFNENIFDVIFEKSNASIGDFIWLDNNGNGLQDDNEKGIEGIKISLIDFTNTTLIDAAETDENGQYLFEEIEPGYYILYLEIPEEYEITTKDQDSELGSKISFLLGQYFIGPFELIAGEDQLNQDGGLTIEPGFIGDFVWLDLDRDGEQKFMDEGIPDAVVSLYNQDGDFIAETVTDENGKYQFQVPAGEYYITCSSEKYDVFTKHDTTIDSETNSDIDPENGNKSPLFTVVSGEYRNDIDVGFEPNTGFIGDFVFLDLDGNGLQDADDVGLKNFLIEAFNESGELVASTVSDSGGLYQIEVPPGNYYLKFSKESFEESTIYIDNSFEENSDITGAYGKGTTDLFTVNAYEVIQNIDAGFLTVNTLIGDYVWQDVNENGIQDDNEIGLGNVFVNLIKVGEGIVESVNTFNGINGDRGYYSFIVDQPGDYYLQFVLPDNSYFFTPSDLTANDELNSDVSNENGIGTTSTFYVEPGENRLNLDAGLKGVSSIIGDFVWNDDNNNGIQDFGEEGINGMSIFLYDEFFTFLDVTLTTHHDESNRDGYYEFGIVDPGNYILVFDADDDFVTANVGNNPNIDSDVTSAYVKGSTDIIELDESSTMFNIDAGLLNPNLSDKANIGDMVWLDINHNGIYETGEEGIANVNVNLINQDGNQIASKKTNSAGNYLFEDVPFGYYTLKCELPTDHEFTIPDNSLDDETDSDADINGYSESFYLAGGNNSLHFDFGLVPTNGIISGAAWMDLNKNNNIESAEYFLPNVAVTLYDMNQIELNKTETNSQGEYIFSGLLPGSYFLYFESEKPLQALSSFEENFTLNSENNTSTSTLLNVYKNGDKHIKLDAGFILDLDKATSYIDLDAHQSENENVIHWTSTLSYLAEYFVVERRTVDDDWEYYGKVQAEGESDYFITDPVAVKWKGHAGYRVKQVNKDLSSFYSSEQWILDDENIVIWVQPNPCTSDPTISFVIEKAEHMKLSLYSLDGSVNKTVLESRYYEEGEYSRTLDINALASGSYILKYESDSQTKIKKLIISK